MKLLEEIENIKSQDLSLSELANRVENAIVKFNKYVKETYILDMDEDTLDSLTVNRMAYKKVLIEKLGDL